MRRVNTHREPAAKRSALAEWAAAAGGAVSRDGMAPPLPECQALGWLKSAAAMVGLSVQERRA